MNESKWVSMWGNAVSVAEHQPASYAKNISLRYPVYVPFDGTALKLTFDNYCGTEAVTLTKVTVGYADSDPFAKSDLECPVEEATLADLTFTDRQTASVSIPAGQRVTCNPLPFVVRRGTPLVVTLYFEDYTLMQSGVLITGPLSCGHFCMGDATHTAVLDIRRSKPTHWFYFLSDIEVLTDARNRTVICYGDSITAQSWPDFLSLRLRDEGKTRTAVVRKAASGARVLRQYDCITYDSYGLKATNRFPHELPVTGADTILIQQGINDIIHPVGVEVNRFRPMSDLPTARELIDGLRWYTDYAHGLGLTVAMGTLLPIRGWRTYAPFREELKNQINDWIRSNHEIDFCVDFELALRDPADPTAFAKGFDSGDHLHPGEAAYRQMAMTVPSELLK